MKHPGNMEFVDGAESWVHLLYYSLFILAEVPSVARVIIRLAAIPPTSSGLDLLCGELSHLLTAQHGLRAQFWPQNGLRPKVRCDRFQVCDMSRLLTEFGDDRCSGWLRPWPDRQRDRQTYAHTYELHMDPCASLVVVQPY